MAGGGRDCIFCVVFGPTLESERDAAIEQRNRLMWRYELDAIADEVELRTDSAGWMSQRWDGWLVFCHDGVSVTTMDSLAREKARGRKSELAGTRFVELEVEIGEEEAD